MIEIELFLLCLVCVMPMRRRLWRRMIVAMDLI